MNSSARRVAVLGGIRIPFARQDGPYAQASNQDMLTATLDALVEQVRARGRGARRGRRRRRAQAQPRLQPDARVACSAPSSRPRRPPTTSSRRAAPGSRRRSWWPTRSRSGRSSRAIAGGVDTTSDAPLALNEDLREVLLEVNRAKTNAARLRALAKLRPQQIVPEIPRNAEPRTGLSMGEHAAIMAREWGIGREEQDELAVRSHRNLAAAYDTRLPRRPRDAVSSGLERDQNLRPDSSVEKLAKLKPVFGGPEGTMTAGNSTPLSDGASRRAAGQRGVGGRARSPRAGVLHRGADGGGRPRPQARGAADGAGLRDADACSRAPALTLQDFDFYEIHEAFASQVLCTLKAWEDPVFCRERLGLDGAARRDRPRQAQRPRRLARRRAPVRRDRRADRRRPRQGAVARTAPAGA